MIRKLTVELIDEVTKEVRTVILLATTLHHKGQERTLLSKTIVVRPNEMMKIVSDELLADYLLGTRPTQIILDEIHDEASTLTEIETHVIRQLARHRAENMHVMSECLHVEKPTKPYGKKHRRSLRGK